MKRFSSAVRTLLAGTSLLFASLAAAPAAQAALKFDGSPGSSAPPATLGGFSMVASPQDTRDDGTTVTDAPATPTSSFSFDQSQQLLTIPDTWCTSNWAGGTYAGRVYWTQGASSVTITLPSPASAVYFYATPNQQGALSMNATATAASGATLSSGDVQVTSNACGSSDPSGQFFGFYGTDGDQVKSVTVTLDDPNANFSDFAFGDFALGSGEVVVDDDLSLSGMPSDVTVDATSPAGAPVTYTPPTANDPGDSASPTVSCSAPSGSTFAIGSTNVTCSASDADDSNGPVSGSFNVTVVGAAGQLADLANAVNGVKPGTSLPGKVASAQSYVAAGDSADACLMLDSFIAETVAQNGKHVPSALAPSLVSAAQQIEAVLGCASRSAERRGRA
jgi:hypothetical protein